MNELTHEKLQRNTTLIHTMLSVSEAITKCQDVSQNVSQKVIVYETGILNKTSVSYFSYDCPSFHCYILNCKLNYNYNIMRFRIYNNKYNNAIIFNSRMSSFSVQDCFNKILCNYEPYTVQYSLIAN